VAAKRTICI